MTTPPVTPDGRYIVVRGRLWRRTDPGLSPECRETLVGRLMEARRAVKAAKQAERRCDAGAAAALADARRAVDAAKTALGERGPVWWADGTPDLTRRWARRTPYAAWYAALSGDADTGGSQDDAGRRGP